MTTPPTPLRLLLIEDHPADAELVLSELRRSGFAPVGPRVETEGDFLAHLEAEWDLILSDFSLPQFDALRALAHVTARGLDVPFIMVSGTVGEDVAVQAMRQGAADYLLKDRLGRLGEAVRRALDERRLRRERLRAEADLRASEARFRALIQQAADVVAIVEADGRVRYVSPSIERVLGFPPGTFVGTSSFAFHHPDDAPRLQAIFAATMAEPGGSAAAELRARHREGSWRRLEVTVTNLVADPHIEGVVVNARDVTERAALEEQLRHQAFHDALTGLPNRALALDRLAHALARTGRRGTYVAVLFLDLDNFKVVNDGLGHAAGDELLVAVGRRLRHAVRDGDTVARFGGDEFVCVLEDIADAAEAEDAAARLAERLLPPVVVAGREVVATASVGVVVSGVAAEGPEDLLRHADQAMYAAKRAGRARAVVFDPAMNARAWTRLDLEGDLRRAIDAGELRLHYQPIVDLANGRIQEAEALVRWHHPTRGMVAPADFISIAEETELIFLLGRWVLDQACRQAVAWEGQRGWAAAPVVSVNVSARQLEHPELIDDVAASLTRTGLPPGRLSLEITERVALAGDAATTRVLFALKELGVGLAVDDFGTGYSGLGTLKGAPVDTLKVDRVFVTGLGTDERDGAIVRAVLALAGALGLATTAEGVETAAQATALRTLGCDRAQGYLFARPAPPEALAALLARDPTPLTKAAGPARDVEDPGGRLPRRYADGEGRR